MKDRISACMRHGKRARLPRRHLLITIFKGLVAVVPGRFNKTLRYFWASRSSDRRAER